MATSLTLWTSQDLLMLLFSLVLISSLGCRLSSSLQTFLVLLLPPKCANPLKAQISLLDSLKNASSPPCTIYQLYREDSQRHIPSPILFLSISSALGMASLRR